MRKGTTDRELRDKIIYFVLRKELGMTKEEVNNLDSDEVEELLTMIKVYNSPEE